jgi:hypothetical protein
LTGEMTMVPTAKATSIHIRMMTEFRCIVLQSKYPERAETTLRVRP